jgi:hypothetical protein
MAKTDKLVRKKKKPSEACIYSNHGTHMHAPDSQAIHDTIAPASTLKWHSDVTLGAWPPLHHKMDASATARRRR